MKEIMKVTEFQHDRILQLEHGLCNINNAERTMQFSGQDVIFIGDEDNERRIDREVLAAAKGGIRGVVSELIYEYIEDPVTGRSTRVENKEMREITREIISIADIIKNQ